MRLGFNSGGRDVVYRAVRTLPGFNDLEQTVPEPATRVHRTLTSQGYPGSRQPVHNVYSQLQILEWAGTRYFERGIVDR